MSTEPQSQKDARRFGFNLYPGHLRHKKLCIGLESSFCKSWACVTSNDGEWKRSVSKPDLVTFKFVSPIWYDPLSPTGDLDWMKITFTNQGKQDAQRSSGLCWNVIYYKYGGHAPITLAI